MRALPTGSAVALLGGALSPSVEARELWSKSQAQAWYAKQPWLVGSNYKTGSFASAGRKLGPMVRSR